jgi:hypothetical protein
MRKPALFVSQDGDGVATFAMKGRKRDGDRFLMRREVGPLRRRAPWQAWTGWPEDKRVCAGSSVCRSPGTVSRSPFRDHSRRDKHSLAFLGQSVRPSIGVLASLCARWLSGGPGGRVEVHHRLCEEGPDLPMFVMFQSVKTY